MKREELTRIFWRNAVISSVLISILVLIAALFLLYRIVERASLNVGSMLAKDLAKYMLKEGDVTKLKESAKTELAQRLSRLKNLKALKEIRIFDPQGRIVFTTESSPTIEELESLEDLIEKGIRTSIVKREGRSYLDITLPLVTEKGETEGFLDVEIKPTFSRDFPVILSFVIISIISAMFGISITMYHLFKGMIKKLNTLNLEVEATYLDIIKALSKILEYRDYETKGHSERVVALSRILGEKLGLSREEMKNLIIGAYLHDIGKIAISDSILKKKGKLTKEEFEEIKKHVKYGVELIENLPRLKGARDVIEFHHEKWDGTGYLKGLKGEEIPLIARTFALVDVYDALRSERPYKKAMSHDEAIEIILSEKGKHFDPRVVDAFLTIDRKLIERIMGGIHKHDRIIMNLIRS